MQREVKTMLLLSVTNHEGDIRGDGRSIEDLARDHEEVPEFTEVSITVKFLSGDIGRVGFTFNVFGGECVELSGRFSDEFLAEGDMLVVLDTVDLHQFTHP